MGGVPVIGTVKANGYGLGTVQFARELVDNGIALLAAARPEEAAAVRNAGIDCPILLLSPVADGNEAELLIDRSITACVGSRDSALLLEETAQRRSAVIEAHLKLDTGFGRVWVSPRRGGGNRQALRRVAASKNYRLFHAFFQCLWERPLLCKPSDERLPGDDGKA